jgi:ABC-2 type transport system permease protein
MTRYPLFWRELRAGRRSFLNWSIPSAFLIWLTMVSFPTMSKNAAQTLELMKSLPAGLRAAFGLDKLDLGEALGYFSARAYVSFALIGGLYITTYGASLLSKEESERTSEFLLTKPISRSQVVLQKAAVLLIYVLAFGAMAAAVTFACFALYVEKAYSLPKLLSLLLGISLIIFCFSGIGFGASAFLSKAKSATSLALGITTSLFVLGTVSATSESLQWMKWLTPFKYADSIEIMFNGLQPAKCLVLVAAGCLGFFLAWRQYQSKDIHA